MQEFRKNNKIKDQQRPSAGAFDAYVDRLIQNGAGSQAAERQSARAARKQLVQEQHNKLNEARRQQKQAMDKLRYEQKEAERRARGKGRLDLEEALHEQKVSRIIGGVLSNVTIEQRNRR